MIRIQYNYNSFPTNHQKTFQKHALNYPFVLISQFNYLFTQFTCNQKHFTAYHYHIVSMAFIVHQIGNTLAWSFLYNFAVLFALLKYRKTAMILHTILGIVIMIMTYIFVLYFLVPFGFNQSIASDGILNYIHGVIGCALLGILVLQVGGGLFARFNQLNQLATISKLKLMNNIHKYSGYFIGVVFKINIIWSWYYILWVFEFLIVWELACLAVLLYFKLFYPKLTKAILDSQTTQSACREIQRISEVEKECPKYVMFGNYVYDASELQQLHPGGHQVITSIMGREVDRFLYGMYSSELFPELPSYSHSAHCLQLIGKPIARITVPFPFTGFTSEVVRVKITEVEVVSSKTKIYALGLTALEAPLVFQGYSDIRQLGQYYTFTISNILTRIYTSVNFLAKQNIQLMNKIMHKNTFLPLTKSHQSSTLKQTQLVDMEGYRDNLMNKESTSQNEGNYLPIMMKIYDNGKFTSTLLKAKFLDLNMQLSQSKGRGLQLETTSPGCIVIVAGGTGLFPFSDLIDLVFKSQLIESNDALSDEIIKKNPVLKSRPFAKFSFVLLLAINEGEDVHPITMCQLRKLSMNSAKFKVVMRVSKIEKEVSSVKSEIEFTRDYFTDRVLTEGEVKDFSRYWICGPPKMSTDTAKNLLKNGIKMESILLI